MKFPHPAFFYHIQFFVMKPHTQKLISQIEERILEWNNTHSGIHSMGGKGLYFEEKEFGHIHWNGDVDIVFGKELTTELLKQNLVQRHKYVPGVAITFHLNNVADVQSAISLLRLAYLKTVKKESSRNDKINFLESEVHELPFNAAITSLL
jgi:uncharacterized protein YqgQ